MLKYSWAIVQNKELQQLQVPVTQKTVPPLTVAIAFIYPVRYSRYATAPRVGNSTSALKIEKTGLILFSFVPEQPCN